MLAAGADDEIRIGNVDGVENAPKVSGVIDAGASLPSAADRAIFLMARVISSRAP